jgi:CheY-like chemotaxis protein
MKRALIIEDEKDIQEILEEILKSECGVEEVLIANDGLEGFHLAMSSQFDIITLDQMMPYCHGIDMLIGLRNKVGPNTKTPVLFISAYIPKIPNEQKQVENTIFIEKPMDIDRLIRYVKMYTMK